MNHEGTQYGPAWVARFFAMALGVVLGVAGLLGCSARLTDSAGRIEYALEKPDRPPRTGPQFLVQSGHVGRVLAVSFSPDGQRACSSSTDGTIRVWDAATGRVQLTIEADKGDHAEPFVAWSPDGSRIGSVGHGEFNAWDPNTGELLTKFKGPDYGAVHFAWSPDGEAVAARTTNGVGVFEIAAGKLVTELSVGTEQPMQWVAWGGDVIAGSVNAYLTPPGEMGFTAVWSRSGKKLARLDSSGPLSIDAAGTRLVVSNPGKHFGAGYAEVWRIDAPARILAIENREHGAIAISPDGTQLLLEGRKGRARLWGVASATGKEQPLPIDVRAVSAAWSRDGSTLAIGDATGSAKVVSAASGSLLGELKGNATDAAAIAMNDDRSLIATAAKDGRLRIWDPAQWKLVAVGPSLDRRALKSVEWAGDTIVTHTINAVPSHALADVEGVFPRRADIWDAETLTRRASIVTLGAAAGLSPDGKLLATEKFGARGHRVIAVVDARNGQELRTLDLRGHGSVTDWGWDPRSGNLATLHSPTRANRKKKGWAVRIWDVRKGRILKRLKRVAYADRLLWSNRGGKLLVWGIYDGVLWDLDRGEHTVVDLDRAVPQIAWGADDRRLVVVDREGDVHVVGIEERKVLASFPAPAAGINDVVLTRDGRFAVLGGSVLRVMRLSDGALLNLRTFAQPNDDHAELAFTPNGLFAGDDRAFERVLFRVGKDLLTAGQMFESFHRPKLVEDFLSGAKLELPRESKKLGRPPRVEFATSVPKEVSKRVLDIEVRAIDQGTGVAGIHILVNGTRVGAQRGLEFRPAGSPGISKHRVHLAPGDNVVTAVAYGRRGNLRSEQAVAYVKLREAVKKPTLHIIAVSIDNYDDPSLKLNYANADGVAVVELLETQRGGLYQDVKIHHLRDAGATRDALVTTIDGVARVARPADVVVFYAAGHGLMYRCPSDAEARYYLLTHGSSARSEKVLCGQSVAGSELASLLRAIPAQKKVLLLDTCQAGGAAKAEMLAGLRGVADVHAIKRLAQAEGVAIVAAAKQQQYANEVRGLGHGVFTYAILQALKGAASRKGRPVTVFGLASYLDEAVPQLARKHFDRPQYPIVGLQGQDYPLYQP